MIPAFNGTAVTPPLGQSVPEEYAVTGLVRSLTRLDDESHLNRLALQREMVEGKGTEEAYARHLKSYAAFWDMFQAQNMAKDPSWTEVPAHPITAAKVAHFLQHEAQRNKV